MAYGVLLAFLAIWGGVEEQPKCEAYFKACWLICEVYFSWRLVMESEEQSQKMHFDFSFDFVADFFLPSLLTGRPNSNAAGFWAGGQKQSQTQSPTQSQQ